MENYFQRQVSIALDLVNNYQGHEPFHHYLKSQFGKNKHWGSKDRKRYRALCYLYWRYFAQLKGKSFEEQLQFLCENFESNSKINTLAYNHLANYLSNAISLEELNESVAQEPPVFLKIKDINVPAVISWFSQQGIDFEQIELCIFKTQSQHNLNPILENGFGYIQDIASQMAMKMLLEHVSPKLVWDTCSGAGGKALDISLESPGTSLFCTDKRASILNNLRDRFKSLNLKIPLTEEYDLLKSDYVTFPSMIQQDLILADVPCTGSGTWRRNPENLAFFDVSDIQNFQSIQWSILQKLAHFVQKGNHLYYMTCSVFNAENEQNARRFCTEYNFEVVFENYFGGTNMDGDTIYGCLMKRM